MAGAAPHASDVVTPMSDAYEVFGERITLESPSDAFRSLVAERWALFRTAVGQPTAASARFEVTLDDAPSRLTAWQFFNNGRLLVIGDDRRLVTGYFHREPWRLHVMAYGSLRTASTTISGSRSRSWC